MKQLDTLVVVRLKLNYILTRKIVYRFKGSTVVHPYNNKSLPALELGASIFVQLNKNLWRAAAEFNLTRQVIEEQNYETGIWDGRETFVSVRNVFLLVLTGILS